MWSLMTKMRMIIETEGREQEDQGLALRAWRGIPGGIQVEESPLPWEHPHTSLLGM